MKLNRLVLYCMIFFLHLGLSFAQTENLLYAAKEFQVPDQFKNRSLPSKADNRTKYLREPFEHMGHPCGFAASLSYCFGYEINLLRDLPSNTDENTYPYTYGYHFHNGGSESGSTANFLDGYMLAMTNGVPNVTAMGGFTTGFPTKWVNGYEHYYKGMKNKIKEYNSFDMKSTDAIKKLKQWLYDHASGTTGGGCANFNIKSMGVKTSKVSSGSESGKTLITSFGIGNYDHSLTVVGYNDDVSYDFNNDGQITSDIDVNRDGEINALDNEKGSFIVVNSHIVWDKGFAFVPYKLFVTPSSQGGIGRENMVFCMKVTTSYSPKYTLKTTITHSSRNQLKIYAGIGSDLNASQPSKFKSFAGAFNYAGGAFPMEGKGMKNSIEIGLDVTDLVDSNGGKPGAFFLCIDSKGGTGTVNKLSLMDYTKSQVQEYPYKENDVTISDKMKLGGLTPSTAIQTMAVANLDNAISILQNSAACGNNIIVKINNFPFIQATVILYAMNGATIFQKNISHHYSDEIRIPSHSIGAGIYHMEIRATTPTRGLEHVHKTISVVRY